MALASFLILKEGYAETAGYRRVGDWILGRSSDGSGDTVAWTKTADNDKTWIQVKCRDRKVVISIGILGESLPVGEDMTGTLGLDGSRSENVIFVSHKVGIIETEVPPIISMNLAGSQSISFDVESGPYGFTGKFIPKKTGEAMKTILSQCSD